MKASTIKEEGSQVSQETGNKILGIQDDRWKADQVVNGTKDFHEFRKGRKNPMYRTTNSLMTPLPAPENNALLIK